MFFRSQSRQSLRRANRFAPFHATANAAMRALADSILQPVIVLAGVAFLFGGSNTQIAAFATISLATWALAPLVLQPIQGVISRQYHVVFAASMVRVIAAGIIGLIGLRIDDISTGRFVTMLVGSYLVYQVASSLTAQASANLVVSSTRRGTQHRLLRQRWLAAVVSSVIAAIAGWSAFAADTTFQHAVGQLLILAALATLAATWFLLQIPGGRVAPIQVRGLSGGITGPFRSAAFRRFSAYKVLLALTAAVDPFLIVFGFRELGLEVSYIGLALFAYVAGHMLGAVAWPRWIAQFSPRVPFQVAALLRLVLLLWVIALPGIVGSTFYTDRFDDATAAMRGFAIGFSLLGLAGSVGHAANQRYLLQIAHARDPHVAILASNVIAAVLAFGPLVVARLLTDLELERVLWGAAGCAVAALLASGLLVESRVRVRTPIGSWRSHRHATRAT